jgi:low temperature requirement protein LtrA
MAERKAPVWWGIPKKFSERLKERKISWLELFYDLVYAAAISQLTDYLAKHADLHGVCYTLFLFAFIYWGWLNGSLYHDLHGNQGVRSRITTLWQMMAVAAVAVTIPHLFQGHHQGFAIAFGVLQLLIAYLWWSTGYYDPAHKLLNRYYVFNYSIGFILFIVSVFTSHQVALWLWAVALFFNLSAGIFSILAIRREMKARGDNFSASDSIIERFGAFTIIVLGEAILGIIHGISECPVPSAAVWVSFVLCMLIAFLLWWIYFDLMGESSAKKGYYYFLTQTMAYLPLLAAFAVMGASIRVLLSASGVCNVAFAKWMFGISIAVILTGTVGLSHTMEQDQSEALAIIKILNLIFFNSFIILILSWLASYMSLPEYLALVAFSLLLLLVAAFRIWMGYNLFTQD